MAASMTTPFSTATPKSAMKPTDADRLRFRPRSHRAAMPPTSANGTFRMTRPACRILPKREEQQQEDDGERQRDDDARAARVARCWFSNWPPQVDVVARRQRHRAAPVVCCASATKLPTSRPRTLVCTTSRRSPFSWVMASGRTRLVRSRATRRQRNPLAAGRGQRQAPESRRGRRAVRRGKRTSTGKRRAPSSTSVAARAADGGLDQLLHVGDVQAVARDPASVDRRSRAARRRRAPPPAGRPRPAPAASDRTDLFAQPLERAGGPDRRSSRRRRP